MTTHRLKAAALALLMGVATIASAQPRPDDRGRDRDRGHDRPPMERRAEPPRDRGPGGGPDHAFYRGDRLPREYRERQYIVNDWRDHHLQAPPRGYQWVQVGADFALVAITTGIITQLLLNQ
jgi:Ni/Co efflux regulator RcnB